MRCDVVTIMNLIGGRQGWAYVCNSGAVKVLKADMEAPQEYDTYKKYGNVRVVWNDKNYMHTCRLVCDEENWKLTSWGVGISASFDYYDMMEDIENSQLQVVKENDIVAIAMYAPTQKAVSLQLFRMSKVNIHCQTVANLIPLTEEEMQAVKKDIIAWLKR